MKINTLKILLLAVLAALCFSTTFILNRYISLEGGHWFWSATLRYIYMIFILFMVLLVFKSYAYIKNLMIEFMNDFLFWCFAGSIGFGIFYALICYVADSSPAWVVATTWQFTILSSLVVLSFFGKKISTNTWILVMIIFICILMVNFSSINKDQLTSQLLNVFLILIASFAYPIGNQLVWEKKSEIDTFSKVFLLSLGSLPFWIVLSLFFKVSVPSQSQYLSIFAVAIFSGVIATTLFLFARGKAKNATQIAMVDATQSTEVLFTIVFEMIFLSLVIPTNLALFGILGVFIALFGLVLIAK